MDGAARARRPSRPTHRPPFLRVSSPFAAAACETCGGSRCGEWLLTLRPDPPPQLAGGGTRAGAGGGSAGGAGAGCGRARAVAGRGGPTRRRVNPRRGHPAKKREGEAKYPRRRYPARRLLRPRSSPGQSSRRGAAPVSQRSRGASPDAVHRPAAPRGDERPRPDAAPPTSLGDRAAPRRRPPAVRDGTHTHVE